MATTTDTPSHAGKFLAQRKRMLIDGEWVEARHGRTLEVYDPALGEVIDHVPSGDAEDIDLAVGAARRLGLEPPHGVRARPADLADRGSDPRARRRAGGDRVA